MDQQPETQQEQPKLQHNYKLKYELTTDVGSFTADQIKAENKGGTDALFLISMLYPEDGSFSMSFFSKDGRNGGQALPDTEMFKAWLLMGHKLSEREGLDDFRRGLASFPFISFVNAVTDSISRAEGEAGQVEKDEPKEEIKEE